MVELGLGKLIGIVILGFAGVGCIYVFFPGLLAATGVGTGGTGGTAAAAGEPFSKVTWDFNVLDQAGAQDSIEDIDIDIITVNDLCLENLKTKGYIDCTGVTPITWDGSAASISIDGHPSNLFDGLASGFCKVNERWAMQVATIANHETSIVAEGGCKAYVSDYKASTSTNTTTNHVDLTNYAELRDTLADGGERYLVLITDLSEIDDVIPIAFLFTLPEKTTANREIIEQGDVVNSFVVKAYADAVANSMITVGGECTDDSNRVSTMDTSLNYASPILHTTATAGEDLKCEVEASIVMDGYCLLLGNPFVDTSLDRAYCTVEPYGITYTNATTCSWAKQTGTTVAYTATGPTTAGGYMIYASSTFEGNTITDNSAADCLDNANERIYDNEIDAFSAKYICGQGAAVILDYDVIDIVGGFDYNAAVVCNDTIMQSNSHSTPDKVMDISCFSPTSATDLINADIDL